MEEIFHSLGIEWKLLIAQMINFGLLVVVLFKFIYKPLLKVLDDRQKTIEKVESGSKEIDQKIEEIKILEKKTLDEARIASQNLIKETEASVNALRQKLVSEAEQEAKKIIELEEKKIISEREKFFQNLKSEVVTLVTTSIEKVLNDRLDEKSKEKITEETLKEISQTK